MDLERVRLSFFEELQNIAMSRKLASLSAEVLRGHVPLPSPPRMPELVQTALGHGLGDAARPLAKMGGVIDAIKANPGRALDLAGLAGLSTLPLDTLQAEARAEPGEDWKTKSLLGGEKGHALGELLSVGALTAGTVLGKH